MTFPLTPADLRDHITTSLEDIALQRLLDDAEGEIDRFAGELGAVTELIDAGGRLLVASRPIGTITSVTERSTSTSPTVLATDDYIQRSEHVLERLRTGTNGASRWRNTVELAYTPRDDEATREAVQLELIKLEIANNPGLASETVGAWTRTYSSIGTKSLPEQRADILARLRSPGIVVV